MKTTKQKVRVNLWTNFWNKQDIWTNTDWKINTNQFLHHFPKIHQLKRTDVILDIGCGEGHLADQISPFVKQVYCLDTSRRFIHICRKKFRHRENISVMEIPQADYTNLQFLQPHTFSVIVCMSVVQYYRSIEELESLLRSIKLIAKSGAIGLIGDILIQPPTFVDAFNLLRHSMEQHHALHTISTLVKARFSEYYALRKSQGLLVIPPSIIERLLLRLCINGLLIDTPLTPNVGRHHLLLYF